MPRPRFIHLRCHTAYSLLEGALQVKALVALARQDGMPAVAIADTHNLFGALEFSEAASAAGIQPIIGCQLDLALGADPGGGRPVQAPMVLLAKDEAGYRNLMALSSAAWLESHGARPALGLDRFADRAQGLICLTGGAEGPLGRLIAAGRDQPARALGEKLAAIFGDRLYVELQRHGSGERRHTEAEAATEPGLIGLAYDLGLPLVATNDVMFADRAFFEPHDALMCIAQGAYVDQTAPRRRVTPEHFFKPAAEMVALFDDLPEAVDNTVEIARRCAFRARRRDPILPRFAEDEVEELRRQAREGLAARLAVNPHAAPVADYEQRLAFELETIEKMGFCGYFLIVADFIKWAKNRGIPVGPGRGSGAGSLVAYALTITDLDPLRYSLLFERFLNPDRVSMPDFDIDFCMDRREEVIAYVQEKYGADRVAQIITFGALLSRAAVRDVGRVLQMPYGQCDRLAKLIPSEGVKPVSIDRALAEEPRLREEAAREEVVARMLDYAGKLEGLYRNASTHAAGVVIADRPLTELVALYRDPRSEMPATQFNMKWAEAAGLVKFDFLGLKNLTVIRNALDLLAARGIEIDIAHIPLDDPKTYALYASAHTVAVFQVESTGMREALRQLKPTCIEDIVALVALYRPGPMENIPKFCNVKNGLEERERLHPLIDDILDETQGIIVYQEQVMEIARRMAGYSLGGADLLRRAMGKKNKEQMDAERPKFIAGAVANGVSEAKAQEVWDLLEKFANYGFNKSHAAAYALVSYQTAWLKANYPVEFMAAAMNCDIHHTDKLKTYAQEVERLGIALEAPCVNRSAATFSVSEGRILYALGGLKNVGVEAMELIVAARDTPFASLCDLARRVDLKRVGKRSLEMLARAGAFDALEPNRRRVFEGTDALIAYSAAVMEARNSRQVSLFGEGGSDLPEPRLPQVEDWLPLQRLVEEHAAIGFYLSGHPLDEYMAPLKRKGVITHAELCRRASSAPSLARIAGAVAGRQERKSARGNRYAFVQLSDPTGLYEVTVFSDTLEASRDLLEPGSTVVLHVEAQQQADQVKLLARKIEPADGVAAQAGPAGLRVYVTGAEAIDSVRLRLDAAEGRAECPVRLVLIDPGLPGEVEMELDRRYPISPQIRAAIKAAPGVQHVEEF
ncbi:MAG: DNA polymerase III subunit alpha [Alphaproteobacteria bacterium]|nr:MAG: DNA polymerase III subunit alpha [Alphaproteobacteria bacterium]